MSIVPSSLATEHNRTAIEALQDPHHNERGRSLFGILTVMRSGLRSRSVLALLSAACIYVAIPSGAWGAAGHPVRGGGPRAAAHARRAAPRARGARHTSASRRPGIAAKRHRTSKHKRAKPALHGNPARAVLAYGAMQRSYFIGGSALYRGEPYAFLWPFSQALGATVSLAEIPSQRVRFERELHSLLAGLERYWAVPAASASEGSAPPPSYASAVMPPLGPGGDSFYDDNEWVGIELVRIYELTRQPELLARAEQIMEFVMQGWQAGPELPCPGGVPFSNSPGNTDRNTITTGPAAELGARLYQLTGNLTYLQFAQQAYAWVRQCLSEPGGLYADHIELDGTVDHSLWSYTQGVMIGAGALLYQATGNSAYLSDARQTAQAALEHFPQGRLAVEVPFFVAVYLRNLLYLDSLTHDPPGPRIAQEYIDRAWQHRVGGMFLFGSPPGVDLLVQTAMVQIYGLLSTSPATYF